MNRLDLRAHSAVVACALSLVLAPAAADPFTADICDPDLEAIIGDDDDDELEGTAGANCIVGNGGDDRLRGGDGDDVLEPGPGRDRATGNGGNDTFVIRGACEIERGEVLSGGAGIDAVRSPFTREQLDALGVRLRSIERVETVPNPFPGACIGTEVGVLCSCCDRTGFDPEAGCASCLPGSHRDDSLERGGDVPDVGYEEDRCIFDATCAATDCGPHGHCMDTLTGASCICREGYAGSRCEVCAPPYEPTADGRCILAGRCAEERCGRHGRCVPGGRAGAIGCRCDTGWRGADCGGPDASIGGPGFVVAGGGPHVFGLALRNGAHCNTRFKWKVVEGRGRVRADRRDSTVATYTPRQRLRSSVEHVRLQATCGNDASVGATHDLSVVTHPAGGNDGVIDGACDGRVAAQFDQAMTDYMSDNALPGATLAITYREQLVCLRAYGIKAMNPSSSESMTTCTPMRVASVTKPFTRAAFRGNLFGQMIPLGLGVGAVGENTPILPILAGAMGLGPNGEVAWQAPAAIYNNSYPPFILPSLGLEPCSSSDGLINSAWFGITINNMLAHTAGFPPNQKYAFSPTTKACTGQMGEVCGSMAGVGDPTVSGNTVARMPNDLMLDHGVVTIDDVTKWMAGICLYDSPAAGRYRYSNVGLTMAGKVIEVLSGQSYESFLVGFLTSDGIVDLGAPGSPVVYQGQSLGNGPKTYSLAHWMTETQYFSKQPNFTDLTTPVLDDGIWKFPNVVPAAYGGANFDIMAPHGGLVMNALALAKFGGVYLIKDGTPRDTARGGAGLQAYFGSETGITHNGLLWGTWALTWELPTTEPANSKNQGPGCLIPGDKTDADDPVKNNGLNALDVEPCPLPPGIRISVMFNAEPPPQSSGTFVRGRHDLAILSHVLRRASSKVGSTAAEWGNVTALSAIDLHVGCDYKCLPKGECVPLDCGDGVLDPGEQCDDGDNDWGDNCEPDCTLIPAEPPGYDDCAGEAPGECLGGPCAPREEQVVSDTLLLDPDSIAHPDGDFSSHEFCHDAHTIGLPWDEATCVRTVIFDQAWGVCRECGVDTMVGCHCPAPNAEDGGCNSGSFQGYSCVGGRCWQGLPPSWMCTADCDGDIYGNGGFCFHDDNKGAVCYHAFCDEPVRTYCAQEFGAVCDVNVNGCMNDSCCTPECLDDQGCTDLGYTPGHQCLLERCRLQ